MCHRAAHRRGCLGQWVAWRWILRPRKAQGKGSVSVVNFSIQTVQWSGNKGSLRGEITKWLPCQWTITGTDFWPNYYPMNGGDEGQRAETDFAITNKKYFASAAKNHQKYNHRRGLLWKKIHPPKPWMGGWGWCFAWPIWLARPNGKGADQAKPIARKRIGRKIDFGDLKF